MNEKKETRGGKRAGAGRKPSSDGALVKASYRMRPDQKAKAARLGGAEWIRQTIDATPE